MAIDGSPAHAPVDPESMQTHATKGPTMTDARSTAQRYVEIATADGKEALAELFAPDATFLAPDGSVYHGRSEIAGFYRRYLANIVPAFHIQRAVADGRDCWIELADGTDDEPILRASNHFTVGDDGSIVRLVVFLRPQPRK
jgi:limonene-1,2-epoxide hydrolase